MVYGRLELHVSKEESRLLDGLRRFGGGAFGDEYGNTTLTWYLKSSDQAVEVLGRIIKALAEERASLRATHDER